MFSMMKRVLCLLMFLQNLGYRVDAPLFLVSIKCRELYMINERVLGLFSIRIRCSATPSRFKVNVFGHDAAKKTHSNHAGTCARD